MPAYGPSTPGTSDPIGPLRRSIVLTLRLNLRALLLLPSNLHL
jgi:hypothetical protein